MKTLSVGEFKTHFSKVLADVSSGISVGVSYGRKGALVAVLVPPKVALPQQGLALGLLKGTATFQRRANYKMTDEELLTS